MKKLLLFLLLVPMVSCSSDDDSGDELKTCNCTSTQTTTGLESVEEASTFSVSVDSVPVDECLSGNSDITSTSGDITVRIETVCTVS